MSLHANSFYFFVFSPNVTFLSRGKLSFRDYFSREINLFPEGKEKQQKRELLGYRCLQFQCNEANEVFKINGFSCIESALLSEGHFNDFQFEK